uniref:Innexin n=1 Tax=Plectus sambesii TaxID=2011161 RepID=A0A914US55_9BILA
MDNLRGSVRRLTGAQRMKMFAGIDILSIIKMAGDTENIHGEARTKAVNTITQHLEDSIALQESFSKRTTSTWRSIFLQFGKAKGFYVTFLYVATKMLYILNVAIQFLVMNDFLGQDNHLWGLQILYDLANGREWEESGNFPRVTLCDFEVRVLGNLHRYTIQCVLMINMFNEKIFLFLWWWFVMVAVATTVNMLYWIITTTSHSHRLSFVERYLRVTKTDPQARLVLNKFADDGLRPDGILVLRMVASHAGDLITTEIINKLWDNFRLEAKKKEEKKIGGESDPLYVNYDDSNTFHPGNIGFIETLYDQPLKLPALSNSIANKTNGVTHRNGNSIPEEREQLISRPQHTTSNV